MTGLLALLVFSFWLLWVYYQDAKARPMVSTGIWLVVVWAVIYGSRPVTEWFSAAGEELSRQAALDEGNPIEALVSLSLIVGESIALFRRRIHVSSVIRSNVWFVVFYLFWFMSVAWSDYPSLHLSGCSKILAMS
ncbi:MAG: hypothetical protein QM706_08970 [Nitrospira sp.]